MHKIIVIAFLLGVASGVAAQTTPATLTVGGEVLHPLTLTTKDLAGYNTTQVRGKDHSGKEHLYTGVLLYNVLQRRA